MTRGRDSDMDRSAAVLEGQRQRALSLGEALQVIEGALGLLESEFCVVLGLSIRFPARVGFDWLIVVRAERQEGRVVAFLQGRTMFDVLEAFVSACEGRSFRWQADQFAK